LHAIRPSCKGGDAPHCENTSTKREEWPTCVGIERGCGCFPILRISAFIGHRLPPIASDHAAEFQGLGIKKRNAFLLKRLKTCMVPQQAGERAGKLAPPNPLPR